MWGSWIETQGWFGIVFFVHSQNRKIIFAYDVGQEAHQNTSEDLNTIE
jgi:hypothetical protein